MYPYNRKTQLYHTPIRAKERTDTTRPSALSTDRRLQALALIAGTLLLYGIGGAWYAHLTGTSFAAALAVCMLPFLPGDALKMAAVIIGGNAVKSRLQKAGLR